MNRLSALPLLLLLWLNAPLAYAATVYKCVGEGEGGSTLFTEVPCKSQKGQKLYYQDNYPKGKGLSELELQELRDIEQREQQKELEKKQAAQQNLEAQKTLVNQPNPQECEAADKAVREWHKIMLLGYPDEASKQYEEELQKRNARRHDMCGQ